MQHPCPYEQTLREEIGIQWRLMHQYRKPGDPEIARTLGEEHTRRFRQGMADGFRANLKLLLAIRRHAKARL